MKYTIGQLQDVLRNNIPDVHDLVDLLDLAIEDVIDRFPDYIKECGGVIISEYPSDDEEEEGELE